MKSSEWTWLHLRFFTVLFSSLFSDSCSGELDQTDLSMYWPTCKCGSTGKTLSANYDPKSKMYYYFIFDWSIPFGLTLCHYTAPLHITIHKHIKGWSEKLTLASHSFVNSSYYFICQSLWPHYARWQNGLGKNIWRMWSHWGCFWLKRYLNVRLS